jgi:predicted DNA-binding transcriptional regulator AlpA
MGVAMKSESPLKAAVSVSAVCRQLSMSRSQFYLHVNRGTFHAPLRLPTNQRPYYTASMVEDIVKARETGVGVNGEYVLFYDRQPIQKSGSSQDHSSLMEGLKNLGLVGLTHQQVEAALVHCFPKGRQGHDESDVLRTVFRHLKRSGTA